jgi:hypothetical protein
VYATADIIWQPETGFQNVIDDLNALLNPTPPAGQESSQQYWVRDVSTNLDRAIVSDWRANETWIVPFKMEDGEPVPAAKDEWTLAEQAWVEAANDLSDRNFTETLKFRERAADTQGAMPETITKISEFSDEQIVALAKTFGIDGDKADELRPKVAAHFKALSEADGEQGGDGGSGEGGEGGTTQPAPAPAPGTGNEVEGAGQSGQQDEASQREMAELRRRAELGERAYEERRLEKREAFVSRLLGDATSPAFIQPAQADDWRKFYDENPELAEAQSKLLPALPVARAYGSDELPTGDMTDEQIKEFGEDAWNSWAASTGVPVEVTR